MIELYADGVLAATDLSHLSFLLGRCGVDGFDDLACAPSDDKRRHHARTVKRALGMDIYQQSLRTCPLPVSVNDVRVVERRPCQLVHRVLTEEFLKCPTEFLDHAS